MSTPGLPDYGPASRRANAKLQRLENERAASEGRPPRDLRAEAAAKRRALRTQRAQEAS